MKSKKMKNKLMKIGKEEFIVDEKDYVHGKSTIDSVNWLDWGTYEVVEIITLDYDDLGDFLANTSWSVSDFQGLIKIYVVRRGEDD